VIGVLGADPTLISCESSVTCIGSGGATVSTGVCVSGRGANPNFDADAVFAAEANRRYTHQGYTSTS